jgi:hypothetical protein
MIDPNKLTAELRIEFENWGQISTFNVSLISMDLARAFCADPVHQSAAPRPHNPARRAVVQDQEIACDFAKQKVMHRDLTESLLTALSHG